MKKLMLFVIGALLVSGCASSPQANSEYSSADISFAEQMIPHHEQAIEMSDLARLNTSNPKVLELAEQIKNAQSPEIELMKSWTGVRASTHSGHMNDGMLSEDELTDLRNAKDKAFDQLFFEGMIRHHEGAIKMAQDVIDSKNKEVAALATSIIKAQELEIAAMKLQLIKN